MPAIVKNTSEESHSTSISRREARDLIEHFEGIKASADPIDLPISVTGMNEKSWNTKAKSTKILNQYCQIHN